MMEATKSLYHANKTDAETFISNFTIRLKEYALIKQTLEKQKTKPLQHFLITGKRGMGKSTLLRRIFLAAGEKELSNKIVPVLLGAEQYRLSRLYKLWEEVIKHLSIASPDLLAKKEKLAETKNYEDHIIHIIIDFLKQGNKTLLLLIDNFDQLIEKLTTREQHALREILIQYPIQIIGNTVFYNEPFIKYDKPFYDFFKPIHLKNLDKEESEDFIKQLAINEGIENFDAIYKAQRGKINTLRILSGGVPRTLVILTAIVSKKNTGDAVDYLHDMLEQVTPLYQDRMKALSAQQQEIMHQLALHWDRTPVKDLVKELRLPSKTISAQLVQLENSGYINKIDIPGRNHYYEIDERFFNIWLLMSEASAYDAKRVIWLTKWLDMFYDNKELEDFAFYCHDNLKAAKPANRFLIAQALSGSEKLSIKSKDRLVYETADDLKEKLPEVIQWASLYTDEKNKSVYKLYTEIAKLIKDEKHQNAITKLKKLKEIDASTAYFGLGLVYFEMRDYTNAEKYYLLAVEKGEINAMNNLGLHYEKNKKDYDNAEKYFLMAVEKGEINAMNNLGIYYEEIKKDYDNAEKYFLMAAERGNVMALSNLGLFYEKIKKEYAKAETYYLEAVEKGDEDAMFNLGNFYRAIRHDYPNSEKYYLLAIEKDDLDAMHNLPVLYFKMNDLSKKNKAMELIADMNTGDALSVFVKIIVLIWCEKIKDAQTVLVDFLNGNKHTIDTVKITSSTLNYFIIFKQKQFLYKLFNEEIPELKDRYKPVYYALLHEMIEEYPKEYLKMPEELVEPVNEILTFINSERERLGIK
jgi:TPR repeat protein